MAKPAPASSTKIGRKEEFRQLRRKQQQRERIILIGIVAVVVLIIAAVLIIPNLPVDLDNYTRAEAVTRSQVNG
jgi:hypothetical protein